MKTRVQATGAPVARECRDGGQIKLSTFIPLKIRKRGASSTTAWWPATARSPNAKVCTTPL